MTREGRSLQRMTARAGVAAARRKAKAPQKKRRKRSMGRGHDTVFTGQLNGRNGGRTGLGFDLVGFALIWRDMGPDRLILDRVDRLREAKGLSNSRPALIFQRAGRGADRQTAAGHTGPAE